VILPMLRVQLLGPRALLPEALELLQRDGALELRAPHEDGSRAPRRAAGPEPGEACLAGVAERAEALLSRLPAARGGGPPATLPPTSDPGLLPRLAALEGELQALEARRADLVEEGDATARFARIVTALAPLHHDVDPALLPEVHGLVLRNDPAALALLQAEVRRIAGRDCSVESRPLDGEHTGVLVVVPRACGRALSALLFERGVDEVKLPSAYAGKSLFEVLLHVASRTREIPEEIARADGRLEELASRWAPALADVAAAARAALARAEASSRCGETRFAFLVSGYMPAERLPALRDAAAARFGERVALLTGPPARAEYGEVPVVLRNGPALRPFQLLLALAPLPRYGSIDPTPWLALFYPLFFGLVLGDVVFGLLGAGVALAARARRWGGATGRDVAWIALACSLAALLFGLLFGEALGELGAHLGLEPVLLDRRRAFMTFLGLALAVGGVHLGIGFVLGVANALRGGHRREALARAAKLLMLLSAAAAALGALGLLPRAVLAPALAAGATFLAAALASEGPMAALHLVLGLGNVLSYARLMALGLASVMLAEVANLIAGTLRPAAVGLLVGVLLHAVNFTLGLISPAIAALRLHYVEFFEKFYEEGGAPWRPFALNP